MVHFIIGMGAAILYCILCMPVYLVLLVIGKFAPEKKYNASRAMVGWIFRVILACCGVKVEAKGLENINGRSPALFVSNHRSYLDILSTYVTTPVPMLFIAKKEVKKLPIIPLWFKNVRCLFLDRSDPRDALNTINDGAAYIRSGMSVWMFPEGHRGHCDTLQDFKDGSLKIAQKAECPIIPAAIINSDRALARIPFVRPSHIVISFGRPILTEGLDRAQKKRLAQDAQAAVQLIYDKEIAIFRTRYPNEQ